MLFTRDDDLLVEASRRQQNHVPFCGVIYAHQLSVTIGQCVLDLDFIAKVSEPEEWSSRVEYLPLK